MTEKPKDDTTGTSIDLGDDLLYDAPAQSSGPGSGENATTFLETPLSPSDDQYQSAIILLNEGFSSDAKKLLHQIIIADPGYVLARKKLDEIHDHELKQLFAESSESRPGKSRLPPALSLAESDVLLRALDRDLASGEMSEGDSDAVQALQLSLFQNRAEMERFAEQIDVQYAGLESRDRLDMGIAFLEMGLLDLAIRQFRSAIKKSEAHYAGTCLLAYALVLSGKGFEATLVLETLLTDMELKPEEQSEPIYLMGRALEQLGKFADAERWYLRLRQSDRHYRDLDDRIRICREKRRE